MGKVSAFARRVNPIAIDQHQLVFALRALGRIGIAGDIPLSTMGGLKGRGHPIGASGVYQVLEVVKQLRGEAGPLQVKNAHTGMAQSVGGSGSVAVTHILQN